MFSGLKNPRAYSSQRRAKSIRDIQKKARIVYGPGTAQNPINLTGDVDLSSALVESDLNVFRSTRYGSLRKWNDPVTRAEHYSGQDWYRQPIRHYADDPVDGVVPRGIAERAATVMQKNFRRSVAQKQLRVLKSSTYVPRSILSLRNATSYLGKLPSDLKSRIATSFQNVPTRRIGTHQMVVPRSEQARRAFHESVPPSYHFRERRSVYPLLLSRFRDPNYNGSMFGV